MYALSTNKVPFQIFRLQLRFSNFHAAHKNHPHRMQYPQRGHLESAASITLPQ